MWTPNHSMRVWLYRRPTDMRKSYNGLSTMVKRVMRDDPLSGALYVFINRRRTQMKCLYFEDDGLLYRGLNCWIPAFIRLCESPVNSTSG